MNESDFNNGLLEFLADSPTPFHAVKQLKQLLTAEGFEQLAEHNSWSLKPGGRYFVVRNGSSIAAIRTGSVHPTDGGLRLIGTHTDSPCLKIKPAPEIRRQGFLQLGVEIYGGVLLSPWFDRDLSLAGKVTCRMENGEINSVLIDFRRPVATVPSLAIHLNRDVHKNRTINPQKEVVLLVSSGDGDRRSFRQLLLGQIKHEHANLPVAEVLDYEISCYDVQPPAVIGLNDDFIAASRLDNLLSCYTACRSIIDTSGDTSAVMVCNDHEEVGSLSASGAQGPFLRSTLERLCGLEKRWTGPWTRPCCFPLIMRMRCILITKTSMTHSTGLASTVVRSSNTTLTRDTQQTVKLRRCFAIYANPLIYPFNRLPCEMIWRVAVPSDQ